MARKIGDIGIALVILTFMMTGFTYLILEFDSGLNIDSGLDDDLSSFSSNLDGVATMQVELSQQVDNASELSTQDTLNQQLLLEQRGSSTSGVLNLFSKNILIRFINGVNEKFAIPTPIVALILGLIGVLITILVARFFFGEGKA